MSHFGDVNAKTKTSVYLVVDIRLDLKIILKLFALFFVKLDRINICFVAYDIFNTKTIVTENGRIKSLFFKQPRLLDKRK